MENNNNKKVFSIPVSWEVFGTVQIEAETLEDAIKEFDRIENETEGHSLPTDNDYIDGSFKREEEIEYIEIHNQ